MTETPRSDASESTVSDGPRRGLSGDWDPPAAFGSVPTPADWFEPLPNIRIPDVAPPRLQDRPAQITDPAFRVMSDGFVAALRERYVSPGHVPLDHFPERFANACDLVVQLLWAEMYGTSPVDPGWHTSDPARQIARLFCDALGIGGTEQR